jgi:hypothetical protein
MIAIRVEPVYRSVTRLFSGLGPKGESDAPITAESEVTKFLNRLKLIWRSDSSMLAIGIEPDYRSVAKLFSEWDPKGESNAPITAKSEVVDFFRQIHSCICSSGLI